MYSGFRQRPLFARDRDWLVPWSTGLTSRAIDDDYRSGDLVRDALFERRPKSRNTRRQGNREAPGHGTNDSQNEVLLPVRPEDLRQGSLLSRPVEKWATLAG